jgi:hypothetical protein
MAALRLAQNQVWRQGDRHFRIVRLERLVVHYKEMRDFGAGTGTHHEVSKKEFCRLIRGGQVLAQDDIRALWQANLPPPETP